MLSLATYSQALEYLYSFLPGESRGHKMSLDLSRMNFLLDQMGNPHRTFKAIHITGTSGKGSTSYLAAAILQEAGYQVGLYASPHLQKPNERMVVQGQSIDDETFTKYLGRLHPIIETMGENINLGYPSYTEILTAMAFLYLSEKCIDIGVIEVNMGGTGDATDVLQPDVAIITNVDKDHLEFLGPTIEDVARKKAGIIKKGCVAISGASQPAIQSIIRERCKEQKTPLLQLGSEINITAGKANNIFSLNISERQFTNIQMKMFGKHQHSNAALAIASALQIDYKKIITEEYIRSALAKAELPGRLEIVNRSSKVILDGAHNPAKMRALAQSLREDFHWKSLHLVFGCKKDKQYDEMLKEILPPADFVYMTASTLPTDAGFNSAAPGSDLVKTARGITPGKTFMELGSVADALNKAEKLATSEDVICVTGSLYIVGEARNYFKLT